MKRLLLIAFISLLCLNLLAQTNPQTLTVKGIVIDSTTNKPLGYVTVALLDAKTGQSVKGGLTKDDGSFSLTAKTGILYQAAFVSIGYSEIKKNQHGINNDDTKGGGKGGSGNG